MNTSAKLQSILKKSAYWLGIVVFGTILAISLQFAKAWTEPVAPPSSNVGAPINTSSTAQTKAGNFNVHNGYIQAYNDTGYYGLLNYSSYGGYFYGLGGVFAQNTSGYYAYLGYPSSSYGLLTNGNVYASDVYLASTGKWLSTLGTGSGPTVYSCPLSGITWAVSDPSYFVQKCDGQLSLAPTCCSLTDGSALHCVTYTACSAVGHLAN